ncbi:MAG: hypothetical protein J6Y23_07880 [Prevotella sp.]|nr:hypothetical protein [Prevotella sp.]
MKRLLHKIHNFLFGHVYYAVIVGEAGSGNRYDIASQIHPTQASAEAHRRRIEATRAFIYIETVKFHSRKNYLE